MIHRLGDLENWALEGRDGTVGTVDDFYFDDRNWTVRYIVVKTGNWLTGRKVLISPIAVDEVDAGNGCFSINLPRERIENAPGAETARPISRRWEADYAAYYGYPYYWGGPYVWGAAATPMAARAGVATPEMPPPDVSRGDTEAHLRSASEVSGYHLEARDGGIGHVETFLLDDDSWTIRYLVVDTSNWIGGRTVLVSPDWVREVDWPEHKVYVDVDREDVRRSPEYHPGADIDADFERRVAEVYRRPVRPI